MAKSPAKTNKQVKVTLVKSVFGQIRAHQETVRGLGLRRMHDSRVLVDTPEVRGMIHAVRHLVRVVDGQ